MFISMPQEFFVPVLFGNKFKLNEETGQMEYDTDSKSNGIRENIDVDLDMVRKLSISKEGREEVKKEMELLLEKSFGSINKVIDILTPEQIRKMNIEEIVDININKFKEKYKIYLNGVLNIKGKTKEELIMEAQYSNNIFEELDLEYIEKETM